MSSPFVYSQRVEFRDTDAAGVAHFSTFFIWMEEAEHAALQQRHQAAARDRERSPGSCRSASSHDLRRPGKNPPAGLNNFRI